MYDLSLVSRQMKLVDRTRECGCSGLPQREYLAKGLVLFKEQFSTVTVILPLLKLMPTHGVWITHTIGKENAAFLCFFFIHLLKYIIVQNFPENINLNVSKTLVKKPNK